MTGILLTLSPEIAHATGALGEVRVHVALALNFLAAVFGDLLGAWLSEVFRSRKLVAALFIMGNFCLAMLLIRSVGLTSFEFYEISTLLGLCNLWAISGTIVVEQFPTSLRALASSASLNLSRGGVIAMNLIVLTFQPYGLVNVLACIATSIACLGLYSTWRLKETYAVSLE